MIFMFVVTSWRVANYLGLAHKAIHRFDKMCQGGVSQARYQSTRLVVEYPSMESSALLYPTRVPDGFNPSPPKKHGYCRTTVWCCRTAPIPQIRLAGFLCVKESTLPHIYETKSYPPNKSPPSLASLGNPILTKQDSTSGIPSSYLAHNPVDSRS